MQKIVKEKKPKPVEPLKVPVRAGYTPPRLTEFGRVGNLTQAGTGTTAEPDMGMSMSTMQRA